MKAFYTHTRAALAGLALVGGLGVAAQAQAEGSRVDAERQCFYQSSWQSWSAPSSDVIYLRMRNNDVYRVDLAHGSPLLQSSSVQIASVMRGTDRVCGAQDFDLRLSDGMIAMPVSVKAITKLNVKPQLPGVVRNRF